VRLFWSEESWPDSGCDGLLVRVRVWGLLPLRSWLFDDQNGERSPMSGYAPERGGDGFAGSREGFAQIEGWLAGAEAAGLGHAELEEQLGARGRELMRRLYQDHLDLRAAREQRRQQVTGADGVIRARAETGHSRPLATVFGQVTVSRIGYRAPGAPNVYPADEQLSLPAEKYSMGLRELAAIEAAGGSIEDGAAAVLRATGVRIGKRQLEQLARRAAADFEGFYARRRPPAAAPAPGQVLVLEADAKGIMMRPGSLRPAAARHAAKTVPKQPGRLSRGEVRTRKRMAEVGTVFDLTPVPRTAADILPTPGPATAATDAPHAAGKWVTASVAAGAAQVVAAVFAEAGRRDPGRARPWIALVDGNKDQIAAIHAEAAARGTDITIIIDLIHVTGYLWDAAWCFHPEASPDAASWVRAHTRDILDGHATGAAAAIRAQAAATQDLTPSKRKTAAKTARYLENKAPYLDYPTALASGWPISTGVIEGACRHLVKDRMAITGARWTVQGAEAILKLRATRANGHWNQYWAYHLTREHQRNHPQPRTSHTLAA
jgi:hypothetical protein